MNTDGFEEVYNPFRTQSHGIATGFGNREGPFTSGPQSIPPSLQLPPPRTPYNYQNGPRIQEQGRMYYNPSSRGLYNAQDTHYNPPWEGSYNTQSWEPATAGINISRQEAPLRPGRQDSLRPQQSPSRLPPPPSVRPLPRPRTISPPTAPVTVPTHTADSGFRS